MRVTHSALRMYERPDDRPNQQAHEQQHEQLGRVNAMAQLRLTYQQLGARTGRSPGAARQLAKRHAWQTVLGNDGKALVLVDDEALAAHPPARPVVRAARRAPELEPVQRGDDSLVQALQKRIASLEGELREMATATGKAEGELAVTRQQLEEARRLAHEHARQLLEATGGLGAAEGEAMALRDALSDLSGRLDRAEATLRTPWWRRLMG